MTYLRNILVLEKNAAINSYKYSRMQIVSHTRHGVYVNPVVHTTAYVQRLETEFITRSGIICCVDGY